MRYIVCTYLALVNKKIAILQEKLAFLGVEIA